MIIVDQFLTKVREIENDHPTYKSGGDGSNGTCDCIGLIIGAIRRAGGKWTGTHGSNYAARYEVCNFRPVSKASGLSVGDIVFKARNPGDTGYDLHATYKSHYDQRDYYHAGVVLSTVPLVIIHCTSPDIETTVYGKKVKTSIRRDSALGKWAYAAELSKVSYNGAAVNEKGSDDMDALYRALVVTERDPLRMREAPETGKIIGHVPRGEAVEVLRDGGWPFVRYGELDGYVSGDYLMRIYESADPVDDANTPDNVDKPASESGVIIPFELARQLHKALSEQLSVD